MIFLLNRVDLRGLQDKPLEQRIKELRYEIQSVLELPELPYVVPFSAQMLFYAQCAWGSSSTEFSDVDPSTRQSMLNGFLMDCAKPIKLHTKDNKQLKRWLRDLEEDLEEGIQINLDDTRKVLENALDWSGGSSLWNVLRERIRSAFTEMIIAPALIETIKAAEEFTSALDIVISVRLIESTEEIDKQKAYIQQRRESCKFESEQLVAIFNQEITDLANRIVVKSDGSPESITESKK
ncbi:MAG: hypothetical protein HC924_16485 [Synechococcaceae cyanobacterium SM2_3_2]|nr:hypothetical protein [Synechococcaceae cyanobacterium SM2_3_2]